MNSLTNAASGVYHSATKVIWGDPKAAEASTEPVSGETGKGTLEEPFDQGNEQDAQAIPETSASSAPTTSSTTEDVTSSQSGTEPVSAETGEGSLNEPYDLGNKEDSGPPQENSTSSESTELPSSTGVTESADLPSTAGVPEPYSQQTEEEPTSTEPSKEILSEPQNAGSKISEGDVPTQGDPESSSVKPAASSSVPYPTASTERLYDTAGGTNSAKAEADDLPPAPEPSEVAEESTKLTDEPSTTEPSTTEDTKDAVEGATSTGVTADPSGEVADTQTSGETGLEDKTKSLSLGQASSDEPSTETGTDAKSTEPAGDGSTSAANESSPVTLPDHERLIEEQDVHELEDHAGDKNKPLPASPDDSEGASPGGKPSLKARLKDKLHIHSHHKDKE